MNVPVVRWCAVLACLSLLMGRIDHRSAMADEPVPEWKRTAPDFPIYLPKGKNDASNQMVSCLQTPRGTWIVTFTMAAAEGDKSQRVVAMRSEDRGRSWSEPLLIDGRSDGKGRRASWGVPFVVPASGRVYVFYNKNAGQNQVRDDVTGQCRLKYSDDDGLTWNDGGVLPIRMGAFGHPSPTADPNWIGLYSPIVTREGDVLFPYARYKAGPDLHKGIGYAQWQTECVLLRFDNILTETDPAKLKITTFPEGEEGLRVPHPTIPNGSWANEPSLVQLSDGRLFMVIRTRVNAVWYAVSKDAGRSWTKPQPLRDAAGDVMLNPNAPPFMTRLNDGRIVMLYFNAKAASTFGPRDPAFITVGIEALEQDPPVRFAKPVQLMTINGKKAKGASNNAEVASYGSFFHSGDELFLIYPDCKYFILGKRITNSMLPQMAQ